MSNLAQIAKHLGGISTDLQEFEAGMEDTERKRLDYQCSTDRIPELVAEGKLLSVKYKMAYAVVRRTDGVFHLIAAPSGNKSDFIALIL